MYPFKGAVGHDDDGVAGLALLDQGGDDGVDALAGLGLFAKRLNVRGDATYVELLFRGDFAAAYGGEQGDVCL